MSTHTIHIDSEPKRGRPKKSILDEFYLLYRPDDLILDNGKIRIKRQYGKFNRRPLTIEFKLDESNISEI